MKDSGFKFGHLVGNTDEPYQYPNVWAIERTTGPDRLVIAPADRQVELLLTLTRPLPEPFAVLYLLLVPRKDEEDGRYLSPLLQRADMEAFLQRFRELFEGDGRHHVWVTSLTSDYTPQATLVYDQHNVIYAYGPLDQFQAILRQEGMTQVEDVRFPAPHSHHYNVQFDDEVRRLLEFYEWQHTPLQPDDEW